VTTALPGTPMLVAYHRLGHTSRPTAVRADFAAVEAWLASFQSATSSATGPLDVAPGLVDTFERRFSDDSADGPWRIEQLLALRRRLRRHRAARTASHGDLWPGNLLVAHGRVSGVVDWERLEPAGSPTRDLARFPVSYSHYLDRHTPPGAPVKGHHGLIAGDPAAAVAYALDGSGWYPDLVRAHLARGLARLGLPAACGRDAALAEVAALAAEATDDDFARRQLRVFDRLSGREPP
jgi:aminoglycoside phosphotransferase (APT) family kinase protein